MQKTYREITSTYNHNRIMSAAFLSIAISDFIQGNIGIGVGMIICDLIKIAEAITEYKNIDDCQEFKDLNKLYQNIVSELVHSMEELNLKKLGERYIFFRYILENNILESDQANKTHNSSIKRKKAIVRPLILNNHGLKMSSSLFLKDLLNRTGNVSIVIDGKVIEEGIHLEKRETNNISANKIISVRKPSLKEKFEILCKPIEHLLYTEEDNLGYFLNPNTTEVYTETNENGYLVSNNGNLFKEKKPFNNSIGCGNAEDLLEYKEFVLERIASSKQTMSELEESLTDKLSNAERIYKRII